MRRLFLALAAASLLSAQTAQTFVIRNAATEQEFNDLANAVLAVSSAKVTARNLETRELGVSGTAPQMRTAEWVLDELDRPASVTPPVAKRLTLETTEPENAVAIFYVDRATTPQGFNELQTALRTLTDVRYVGPSVVKRAIALRGSADQLDFAAWLLTQPDGQATAYTYPRVPDRREYPDNIARVFRYPRAIGVQGFNDFQTMVRTISDARRVYPYAEQRVLFLRDSSEAGDIALWLAAQLDRDLPSATKAMSPVYTMTNGDLIRLFHFDAAMTQQAFRDRATTLRTATGIRRVYPYESARTLAVRGTAAQLTQFESLFQQ